MGLGLENPLHLAVLVLIVVLLFGARRLPELGRSIGSGIREFRGSVSGEAEEVEEPKAIESGDSADSEAKVGAASTKQSAARSA